MHSMSGRKQVLGPPTEGNCIKTVDTVVICFQFKKKPYKEELSVSVVFDPQKRGLIPFFLHSLGNRLKRRVFILGLQVGRHCKNYP